MTTQEIPVLHADAWREPLRDRVARAIFVRLMTPSYARDIQAHAVGEIIADTMRKARK